MNYEAITILSFTVIFFSLISNKLHNSVITLPIAFTVTGFLFGSDVLNLVNFSISSTLIRFLAEITLVLVLYSDASRIKLTDIQKYHNLPIRLLLVGLPLTIIFGAIFAKFMFANFSWFEATLLAAILTPTDAALIHTVVSYKKVPMRIRQTLNIESGLNDGLMVPIIVGLLSYISASSIKIGIYSWIWFLFTQITIGAVVGYIAGYLGTKICEYSIRKKWMNCFFEKLSTIAIVFLAYSAAQILTGNGFIAAFICGLSVSQFSKSLSLQINNFAAVDGQLFVLILFFFFGASFLNPVISFINWKIFIYAILSLTIIRIIPVFLSILGCALKFESFLYLGWFGPRGVASIVFAFLMIDTIENETTKIIFSASITTIFLSIFFHGITSFPFARWYARRLQIKEKTQEHKIVPEMPTRLKSPH